MARSLRLASFAAALWLSAGPAFAAAVAFVSDLQGEARLAKGGKVKFLAELEPATHLVLEKDARVVVIYAASGTEYTLKGPAEFVVEEKEVKSVKGNPPARRNVAKGPDMTLVTRQAEAATASVRMRGVAPPPAPPARPALLYPREGAIATLQPVLQWSAQAPADGFTVIVIADGKPVWRGSTKGQSLKVGMKLRVATQYSWTLLAGGAAVGEQRFNTLPEAAVTRANASQLAAKSFSDRVLHAFVLQDVGAQQDARQVWAALAKERPDLSELAVLAR